MTMRVSDKLVYPSRATVVDAVEGMPDSAMTEKVRLFAVALNDDCNKTGIDFAYAFAHAANECDYFRDSDWTRDTNAFGIGNADGSGGVVFPSPVACADFFTWELLTKMRKDASAFTYVREYAPAKYDRVSTIVKRPDFPLVERIDDLNQQFGDNDCVWMCDERGPEAIVAKGNALFPNVPDQGGPDPVADLNMSKGLIPLPTMISDIIDVAARNQSISCRGYDHLGARPSTPAFLVLHRSINGVASSNSGYFHETCCPALTDTEVIAANGTGRRFVALPGNVSGWANGVVKAPYGDALAWLNLHDYDLNTVNRDGESCEITGNYDDPVSEAAWAWLAKWIASRAHDYGITHETFPLIPKEGNRSYITWHQEWTIGTGKICPGPVVMNYTATLIERARGIMKAAQTNGKPPVKPPTYADPIVPSWLEADIKQGYPEDHKVGDLTYFAALRPYEATKAANRLQKPDTKAAKVGPRLDVRERFRGMYLVKKEGRLFVVTQYGSYIDASALTPRVSVRAA